jgi:uncharacterized zinc-type alcohol dehydrogenase-like protein
MAEKIKAYAVSEAKGSWQLFEYDPGELRTEQIEIKVTHCGICHSDMSMQNNDWNWTTYPFVGGHEAVGVITQLGEDAVGKGFEIGDTVGLGWNAGSCMHCDQCIAGNHIDCPELEQTIIARQGAFAERVRFNWEWGVKLPDGLDPTKAGPLFCGGITVFNPFVQLDVKPTDKVGVVGIGGLGHLALQFADKWGCEVTAFTSNLEKIDELKRLGADYVVNSRDDAELEKVKGKFDLLIVTVNVPLNWEAYMNALAPRGHLHVVGAVPEPLNIMSFQLIAGQKAVSGTATGSPGVVRKMVEFCARHGIEAVTETFPMSKINDAFEHLHSGKARYRIVLEADF